MQAFFHLTGFEVDESKISPKLFFRLCSKKRLSPESFKFADDGTTELKLDILPSLMQSNISAKMIGEYNGSYRDLYTEVLAGGVRACMGFVSDYNNDNTYHPNTVLNCDIRTEVKNASQIIRIYRKPRKASQYSEVVYSAKNYNWDKAILPKAYAYLK